jgi:hypothetical protein
MTQAAAPVLTRLQIKDADTSVVSAPSASCATVAGSGLSLIAKYVGFDGSQALFVGQAIRVDDLSAVPNEWESQRRSARTNHSAFRPE